MSKTIKVVQGRTLPNGKAPEDLKGARGAMWSLIVKHDGKTVADLETAYLAQFAKVHGTASVRHPKSSAATFKKEGKGIRPAAHAKPEAIGGWVGWFVKQGVLKAA